MSKETDLYLPIKKFFEANGYEVKAEITNCDVVARRNSEPPVIIELKLNFSLELILQGIQRLSITEHVYIAVAKKEKNSKHSIWKKRRREILAMCKRLGLGVLVVNLRSNQIEVLTQPGPYQPKNNKPLQKKLLGEFDHRKGDPNLAGSTKIKIVTAYRQNALLCALAITELGPLTIKEITLKTNVENAASILQNNYYGWFTRIKRGVYNVSPEGIKGIKFFHAALPSQPVNL